MSAVFNSGEEGFKNTERGNNQGRDVANKGADETEKVNEKAINRA